MKRMLINATQQEELRVALVDGQRLYDLDIESAKSESKKSNIYKGKITRIEPSLEAVFIDYGEKKNGFLPLKDISQEYFPDQYISNLRVNIQEIVQVGQELIVQINKEERGKKGAALTTFISLAGSYLVLMPNSSKSSGISRRIEGNDRLLLKESLNLLIYPENMSLIIRTAGSGKSIESLQWDLSLRLEHWKKIQKIANTVKAPFLIHQESNIIFRAFRDYLRKDIGEILIDNPKIFKLAQEHINFLGRPDFANKIKLYTGDIPLFSYFQIETQINSAFQRKVRLPSGGSIMLDSTEALTAIDINSSRSKIGTDIESTAFNTNLEAVDEISRQLRLRDLGGLIVIDFIDMSPISHQRAIENRLREIAREDRARIQIGQISQFGLLEMSRQRLSSSLGESSYHICPRCTGTGTIRDSESLSLSILRLIEEEALKENTYEVRAIVPIEIACYLLNEKREAVYAIEKRQAGGKTIIIPSKKMKTPHYSVSRIKKNTSKSSMSYSIANIKKNTISKLLNKKIFTTKMKKKCNYTNFITFENVNKCKNKIDITEHKKSNYNQIHKNIFLKKKYQTNVSFIFKVIDWLKSSFSLKNILITSSIFNKNSRKNNTFLKEHNNRHIFNKNNFQKNKKFITSQICKNNITNIIYSNKLLKFLKKNEHYYLKQTYLFYEKRNIQFFKNKQCNISNQNNIFYNIKKKENIFDIYNLNRKNIHKKIIYPIILLNQYNHYVNNNSQLIQYFNFSNIVRNKLINHSFLYFSNIQYFLFKIALKFIFKSPSKTVLVKYPIMLLLDEIKSSINILYNQKINFSFLLAQKQNINNKHLSYVKKRINKNNLFKKYKKNKNINSKVISSKFLLNHKEKKIFILNKNNLFCNQSNINSNYKTQSSAPITKISEMFDLNPIHNVLKFNSVMISLKCNKKFSAGVHAATNFSNSPVSTPKKNI